jgi:hypothetical protein
MNSKAAKEYESIGLTEKSRAKANNQLDLEGTQKLPFLHKR